METCPTCGGEGTIEVAEPLHDDPHRYRVVKCYECNGAGWVASGDLPEDFDIE